MCRDAPADVGFSFDKVRVLGKAKVKLEVLVHIVKEAALSLIPY